MKISKMLLLGLMFLSTILHAETTWTTGTYANNQDTRQELSIPNATRLIVSVVGTTENNYDFIYIYNNRGRRIKRFSGTINEEFTITGSTITARLRSDFSVVGSGVTVTIREVNTPPSNTTWTTGRYQNNQDIRQQLSIPNATGLTVSMVGTTENGYDFIYIYDAQGNEIKKVSGSINEEFTVNGSTITARLRSDYSIIASGVTVTIRTTTTGPVDTTAPVITLNGGNVTLTVGDTYSDAGATANDNVDGDITANIQTSGSVDTTTAGTYTITYAVSDAAGNAADSVSRTVTVNSAADTTKPIITLNGTSTVSLTVGDTYTDAGATANDNVDGDISANIQTSGTVNTATAGTYTITYTVSDTAGNAADSASRTVTVSPSSSSSTVWTTGAYSNNQDIQQNLSIANATQLIVTVSGVTENAFDFIYIYDNNGNEIKKLDGTINEEFTVNGSSIRARLTSDGSVTRSGVTVTIRNNGGGNVDRQKPVITLNGASTVSHTVGDTYTDAGATANDNVDGDISANIQTSGTVNTATAGTYTITYTVSDAAGNAADSVSRTVTVNPVTPVPSKVFAFYADEHNDFNNTTTGEGSGNRILQIDIENMSLVNSLDVSGILGHHADNSHNSKIYAVPKGSNFVNVVQLRRDQNNNTSMTITKQISLTHKPRSGDAYNSKYNVVLMAASNRPMGSFINVNTDEVIGTIGQETDCTLTDGTQLLSHADANTAAGALKYQCALNSNVHGGTQITGHPYWLTEDIAAIVDRANNQISVYRINQNGTQLQATLMNRVTTRTTVHQIVPRDRTNLPTSQQNDFYAVEEGRHVNPNDFSGGIAHALLHLQLTTTGLRLVRRMDLQRTEVLPKVKAERILNSCIDIYRATFNQALTGPSQTREDRYNTLFTQEGITRNADQDQYNDFPVDCFYPGIPGGHNADFAPNNRHLYIGMAGGAMSIVDVNRWKIANNVDIGIGTGPGHTCFSVKNNVALSSNHGFSDTFPYGITRTIRYINSERPIGYYWIRLPFDRENITNVAVSHTCHVDASGDNYYNFFTDGGTFYKIDLTGVFNNPTNGSSDLVVDSLYTGGVPIQGSYINLRDIRR